MMFWQGFQSAGDYATSQADARYENDFNYNGFNHKTFPVI